MRSYSYIGIFSLSGVLYDNNIIKIYFTDLIFEDAVVFDPTLSDRIAELYPKSD